MADVKKQLVTLTNANLTIEDLKIDTIIDSMTARLLSKLVKDLKEVPKELEFILLEVCVKRYNQIGDEGYSSRSQEGESLTLSSIFDEFEEDIAAWNEKNSEPSQVGKWSML
ncbi:phage head-tail connector protein [Lactococcus lactis]|uniref:phage head-tail connector protein n=1 Tax=Lactococcus lactis TaxID=1358 RepID=UPI0024187DE2|nr:phage head-tail connector protein [Lactococcus lactis]MDG4966263.1 phage head-tail connector protein [Lactococcus lactis]